MMSEVPRTTLPNGELKGPNYFGFYKREIQELLYQKEDFDSSFSFQNSITSSRRDSGKVKVDKDIHDSNGIQIVSPIGCSLFGNGIGDGLSDFKKEKLKTSLKQSVTVLSKEVDEMLDPVINMNHLKALLGKKENSTSKANADDGYVNHSSYKKLKISNAPSSTGIPGHANFLSLHLCEEASGSEHMDSKLPNAVLSEESQFKVLKRSYSDCKTTKGRHLRDDPTVSELDEDLQILDAGGSLAEEVMKKHSDELSAKLEQMEQQLQDFLDTVMSKCREMSWEEKCELVKLIRNLPPKNLHHVVEILHRGKPHKEHPCNEIHIELAKKDNVTLWRLYYYVTAVVSAKRRPSG